MSVKRVKFTACDRCPKGREREATRSEVISIGDSRWRLDLCEDCGRKLDRELWAWGRLGESLDGSAGEAGRVVTAEYMADARRAAELRSKQRELTRPERVVVQTAAAVNAGLPADAGEWVFTAHAQERLIERELSISDVLRVASRPDMVRQGHRPGTLVHLGGDVKVVVNPATKEILTVANTTDEAKEAIS